MTTININAGQTGETLDLGRRGENGVTQVLFDVSAWVEEFGSGALSLYVRRKGDSAAYPVALTATNGVAAWTVSDTDTNVKGFGRAELVLTVDGVVKKSAVWNIYVGCDIGQPTGSPPDPYESWLERLGELGAETQENAEAAADSASDAGSSASDAADSADAAADSAEAAAASAEQAAAAAAHGIPAGGTRGQVLTKLSGEDFDAGFEDPSGDVIVLTAQIARNMITGEFSVGTPPDISGLAAGDFERSVVYVSIQGYEERFVFYPYYVPSSTSNTYIDYRCDKGNIVYTLSASKTLTSPYTWAFRQTSLIDANGQNAMTANLNLGGHEIRSLKAGTNSTAAVNVQQLNDAVSALESYADTKAADKLPLAGGTMTGAIAMGSHKITGLSAGTNNGDAVNLGQVSDMISTNTAYFRGSFASLAALQAVPWQTANPSAANYVTNNDYAIVLDDEDHDDECWRYVYVTGTGWSAQYRINEAPLTVAQLAALNSGATAAKIDAIAEKIDAPASASAGDVLTYSNGAWTAAAPSGGGTVVVVASMSGLTITADHTYAELAAAAQADTPIVLLLTDGATEYVCTSCKVYASKISFDLKPQWVDVVGGGVTNLMSYRVDVSADGWEFWVSQSQLTPASIGAAAATAVPSAYTSTPAALGTASPGSSAKWAKGDHVHAMPSASDVGAAPAITEVAVSTAGAVTQALDAGKLYHFTGALTALTVTLNAAGTGVIPQYHFDFDSGAAAPTLTLPNTVTMPDGFTVEASKHYEVDILNGYGVVSAWATS